MLYEDNIVINKNAVDTIFIQEAFRPEDGHEIIWINFKEELPSEMFGKINKEEVKKIIEKWKEHPLFKEKEYQAEYVDSTFYVKFELGDWIIGLREYDRRARIRNLVPISDRFWINFEDQARKQCYQFMNFMLRDVLRDNYKMLNIVRYDGAMYYKRCKIRGEL